MTDTKSLTVRSTWKNKAAAHVEESGKGRGGKLALTDAGSEDEAEATWRAYRATTTDNEESVNSGTGPGGNTEAQRGAKPSPAEVRSTSQCRVVSLGMNVEENVAVTLCFALLS